MWDYYHNGFPIGIALEVFTFNALKKAKNEAKKPSEKEHVSPYIVNNSNLFKLGNIENDENQSDIRLTVDHQIDFDLIQIIIEHFKEYEYFSMEQLV
jgi:spore coat polysaccharide biosynthesis protein SpsF